MSNFAAAISNGLGQLYQGVLVSVLIALASTFIADNYGGPTLLYALLFGMVMNSVTQNAQTQPGINFCSKTVLRVGVALLGARISMSQIASLGWPPVILVACAVIATIVFGMIVAAPLKLSRSFGILTGGAVAICGASAALALSAVLPNYRDKERDTLFTVVAVTILSTTAMILYPLLARALGLSADHAGFLFGATIHDVAQVVAAGQIYSDEAGLVATYTKLFRVALLLPAVMLVSSVSQGETHQKPHHLIPLFLIVFASLVVVNSLGWIAPPLAKTLAVTSRWCLVCAIAALGMKTSLNELAKIGWRPLILMTLETVFLLCFICIGIAFLK